jgi:tRNA dimethylallyltransferase
MHSKYDLITVIGPTASGKTAFAAHLANRLDSEVISADSRQIYRRMNLGTGKDYEDYLVGAQHVPVHLIDIAEPGYKYSVFEFRRDFIKAWLDIRSRGKTPIMCGGSAMYVNAVTRQYRLDEVPENIKLREHLAGKSLEELGQNLSEMKLLHNKTDIDTWEHAVRAIEIETFYLENERQPDMPEMKPLYLGIIFDRQTERERITQRLNQRLEQGLQEEVKGLLDSGIPPESLLYYGLEYKYLTLYILNQIDFASMKAQLNTAIHQFAKRQRTWFRKMEREGCTIHWIAGELPMEEKIDCALSLV